MNDSTAVLEARNLGKTYADAGGALTVLQGVDLRVAAGESVAIMGASGAGKSTLLHLLGGLDAASQGEVWIDGRSLTGLGERERSRLRNRSLGFVYQFHHLLDEFTVRENIGFGQVDELENTARIEDAADRGGAAPIIERMPQGYDTMLGRRWEKGAELSGGQWQKIALARAFMREAEVLVLDEPTSALDAEAEYEVFRRFGELMEGRIAVLISHRFSTVRMADRIVVLSAGKIIELGSHAELMALDGAYARLFNLQAEGYR